MEQPTHDIDPHVRRIFDRLRITPQHFLDYESGLARQPFTQLTEVDWAVTRRRGWRWPFSAFWRIDLDALGRGLRSGLDAAGVGYCYILKRQGKLVHFGASGWAQLPADGATPWLFHIPMNVASVSKFVTAIALIRLLRDLKIPVTQSIGSYLPQYWSVGTGAGWITFANLLRHEAGLGGALGSPGPADFATAKAQVALGSSGTGTYNYMNCNFTLLRVLFATLTGAVDPRFVWPNLFGISADSFWDFASIHAYANYVNDGVYWPAINDSRGFSFPDNGAKAYATPPAAPGWGDGDTSFSAGASGWYLSVGDLMYLLGALRRGGSIMAAWRANDMLSNLYGLDQPIGTNAGTVYTKGGRWGAAPRVHDSGIFILPGDVELAVFVNSWDGTGPGHLGFIPKLLQDSVRFVL
jgi:CubicO group peptidase (beta-lactamase class C family)